MEFNSDRQANIFNVPFSAQTLSTNGNWDLWVLTPSSGSRVQLLDIDIGQASTNPTAVQSLGVQIFRGSTGGSGGSAITAVNTKGWTGSPTAVTSATGPSTTLASTTSATLVYASAFEAAAGRFRYRPWEDGGVPIVVTNSQRLHVRATTPQLSVIVHGTLTFKELGYGLPA